MTQTQTDEQRDIALVGILAVCVSRAKRVRLRTKKKVLTVEMHGINDEMMTKLQQLSREYK